MRTTISYIVDSFLFVREERKTHSLFCTMHYVGEIQQWWPLFALSLGATETCRELIVNTDLLHHLSVLMPLTSKELKSHRR